MKIKLSIQGRLFGFSAAGLAFILLVGGAGYLAMSKLSDVKDDITDNGLALRNQLQADMAHDAMRGDVLAAQVAGLHKNEKEMAAAQKGFDGHAKRLTGSLAALETMHLSREIKDALAKVRPHADAYLRAAAAAVAAGGAEAETSADKLREFSVAFDSLEGEMEALSELIEADSKNTQAEGDAAASTARSTMAAITVFAGVALFVIGLLVSRSVTRPLSEAVRLARKVADGDLTSEIEVKSTDETGMLLLALRDMNLSLRKIVGEVRSGTDAISTASAQIASGNADLSERTEQQASSLEETASSMEELASTVKQNVENAKQANQLAASASDVALKGGAVVGEVVQTMASINDSSKKIADIIGVIDGIAFQTNILALNAAVEAARAGEQGRGFAVVASEVRTLAQRSAGAAKEIKALISESVQKVESGTRLVGDAGRTMEEIVGAVKRVADIMTDITSAAQEQSAGIEQVNTAVMQMDTVTQQNAALVEQAAAAAESMREQAVALGREVAVFRIADAQCVPAAAPVAESTERRASNRAQNVSRLPARAAPKAAQKPVVLGKTGTDGDWSEF
jgi:methyl-accepting chemotaxis protein